MNNRIKAIILVAMTIIVLVFIFLANKDSSDIKILTKKKEFNEIYYSNQPKLLFVDLRDEEDYAKSHLDNFVNIPYSEGKEDIFFKFLDDNKLEERQLGLEFSKDLLLFCDEMWVFGTYVSSGMMNEISLALEQNMKVKFVVSTGACNCLE